MTIKVVLELYGISREDIKGGIICSVVPQITSIVRLAAEKVLRRQILVVGPGIKNGSEYSHGQSGSAGK